MTTKTLRFLHQTYESSFSQSLQLRSLRRVTHVPIPSLKLQSHSSLSCFVPDTYRNAHHSIHRRLFFHSQIPRLFQQLKCLSPRGSHPCTRPMFVRRSTKEQLTLAISVLTSSSYSVSTKFSFFTGIYFEFYISTLAEDTKRSTGVSTSSCTHRLGSKKLFHANKTVSL